MSELAGRAARTVCSSRPVSTETSVLVGCCTSARRGVGGCCRQSRRPAESALPRDRAARRANTCLFGPCTQTPALPLSGREECTCPLRERYVPRLVASAPAAGAHP